MAWRLPGAKPLSEPIMGNSLTHMRQWVSSLRLSDINVSLNWIIIGSGNGLAPVQCWIIVNWTASIVILSFSFKKCIQNVSWKMAAILSWPQGVKELFKWVKPVSHNWQNTFMNLWCATITQVDSGSRFNITTLSYQYKWMVLSLPQWMGLTHWGRDKMAAISQTIFSNTFSWMKMYEFWFRFTWNLFLRVQLTIFRHWFR